jgi:hypothetical protein
MIRLRTIIVFLLALALNPRYVAAQDDYSRSNNKTYKGKTDTDLDKKKDKNNSYDDFDSDGRVVWGGGFGMQFGDVTMIEISPKIGYRLTQRALLGAGGSYIYYREDYRSAGSGVYKTTFFSANLFGNYEFIENLFGHIEYEALNFEYFNQNINDYQKKWIGNFFIGPGYRQPIGDRGFIQISLLYNLNYTSLSPYPSPWVPRISIFL